MSLYNHKLDLIMDATTKNFFQPVVPFFCIFWSSGSEYSAPPSCAPPSPVSCPLSPALLDVSSLYPYSFLPRRAPSECSADMKGSGLCEPREMGERGPGLI